MALASLVVAIVAIVVSAASAAYARQQARAASKQAQAAEVTKEIERDRRHAEMTPVLKVTCKAQQGATDQAELTVELTGPDDLDRLDEVTVRIRDDMPDRKPRPGSELSQEQIAETIWGPYKIKAGLRDTDEIGRMHGPFALPKNEPYPIPLEHTTPPPWNPRGWWGRYDGKPVRLMITCRREGHQPWEIPVEVKVKRKPKVFVW